MNAPKHNRVTETGQVPQYEPTATRLGEPTPPPSLPEMEDPRGATGVIQIISEGKGDSKDEDDPLHVH